MNENDVTVKRGDLEGLSKAYSNAATAVGNDVQQQTTRLSTAQDTYNESAELIAAYQDGDHKTMESIIGRIG